MDDEHPTVCSHAALDLGADASHDRVVLVGRSGMHHHAGWFLDDHQILVEVKDVDPRHARSAAQSGKIGVVFDWIGGGHKQTRIGDHRARDQHMAHLYLASRSRKRASDQQLHAPRQAGGSVHVWRVTWWPAGRRGMAGFQADSRGWSSDRFSDPVSLLLARASAAGLGGGWVAAALSEGETGRCWVSGRRAVGGEDVRADLWFDLASLTKPLITTTLLVLAGRDGLGLDEPLGEFLPELKGSPWAGVTLGQCATHTAGFPAWEPLYLTGLGHDAYLVRLRAVQPAGAPGHEVIYSCLGFVALGMALERAGGADLATLSAELVLAPLGLTQECGFAPERDAAVAAGEVGWWVEQALLRTRGLAEKPPQGDGRVWPCDDGNARGLRGVAGNAGLFGSAAAVARIAAEYLPGGGELLTSAEASLATRCHTQGLSSARGLGWQLAATPGCSAGPALGSAAFGHTGFTGVSVWVDPTERSVLVLLGNRLHPGGRTPDLHPLRRTFHRLARSGAET